MKKWFVVSLVVLLSVVISGSMAQAAEFRPEAKTTVAKNEVIDDDLYIAGGNVIILGTVNGDLIVAGGTIDIDGTIGGDVAGTGGMINVRGNVADDIRIAGGSISVSGDVGGDVLIAGGTAELVESGRVGGDLCIAGGNTNVAGEVAGRLFAGAGQLTISGQIGKDAIVGADMLTLEPSAKIAGDLTYTSAQTADIKPGAEIAGTVTHEEPEAAEAAEAEEVGWSLFEALRDRFRWLLTPLILGLMLVFVFPQTSLSIADTITGSPWRSLGIGLLVLLVVPVAIGIGTILGIVVGGFPITLALVALFALALLASHVFVGIILGDALLRLLRREDRPAAVWSLLLGLLILTILGLVPFVNALTMVLTLIFGGGALVLFQWRALSVARSEGRA